MRIAVLTTDSVPNLGGVSDYLDGLMTAGATGAEWLLVTTVPAGEGTDPSYPVMRVEIPFSDRGRFFGDFLSPLRRINTFLWMRRCRLAAEDLLGKIVRDHEPDIVVIGCWNRDSHWWCRACQRMNMPYAIIVYGLEIVRPMGDYMTSSRVQDLSRASLIISDSSCVAEIAADITGRSVPLEVVNPGVQPEVMKQVSSSEATELLKELGVSSDFILTMGRHIHRKGFDLVVRAFDDIAGEHPGIGLVIAGDGEHGDRVRDAVASSPFSDRIVLTGRVSDMQRDALLQECRFFVMANRPVVGDIEGFGIVFLQAAYCGKAVIGGDNGGVPDAVVSGRTGLLVDTTDALALSGAMAKLLSDGALAESLGNEGRRRVLEEFTWDVLSKKFIRELEDVTGKK